MAAAGLLLFVADAVDITGGDDKLATIARGPGRHLGWAMLGLLATLLLIPGTIGLMRLLADRRPVVAAAGGALAMIGVIGFAAQRGIHLAFIEMASGRADHAQMRSLFDRLDGSPQVAVIIVAAIAGTLLGQLALTVGLWRAGRLPVWVASLLVLSVVVGGGATSPLPSDAIWALALGWAGLAVARGTEPASSLEKRTNLHPRGSLKATSIKERA